MEGLPLKFSAPILVAVHLATDSRSVLSRLVEYAGFLPARHVRGEAVLRPGQVYVASPNWHLVVERERVITTMSPKVNLSRPAIDVLFQSAAAAHGPNVIAVLLSGYLDDGSNGLMAVKERGGTVIVQDPDDTEYGDMPRHALAKVAADRVLPVEEIAGEILRFAQDDGNAR